MRIPALLFYILLLSLPVSANQNAPDNRNQTPIILSATNEAMLSKEPEQKKSESAETDVNSQDKNGQTALMRTILKHNGRSALNTVQFLIGSGANVDLQNKNGDTALMLSIQKQKFRVTNLLIKNGASAHIRNSSGKDAYDLSTEFRKNNKKNKRLIRISRAIHGMNDVKIDISNKKMNNEYFKSAASKALKMRGWTPSDISNESITGTYIRKDRTYKVTIKRTGDLVQFAWVVGYENETPSYLQNLRIDFKNYINTIEEATKIEGLL